MKLISLYLPETYLKALDILVKRGHYPSRAEAIRFAIRDLIQSELGNAVETPCSSPATPQKLMAHRVFHGTQKRGNVSK
jgi:Arc/MetJ-type ribon-helix-helix transcriptional regulator